MRKKKPLLKDLCNLAWLSLAALLSNCAIQIPNTKVCAIAGVSEAGFDCFHTLSDEEESIPPEKIKDFIEAMPDIKDDKGNVIEKGHGAAICQPSEDWGAEHTALEAACQKLGAACSYDIKKVISDVNAKVEKLQKKSP